MAAGIAGEMRENRLRDGMDKKRGEKKGKRRDNSSHVGKVRVFG